MVIFNYSSLGCQHKIKAIAIRLKYSLELLVLYDNDSITFGIGVSH
jgi:hypothetical protein